MSMKVPGGLAPAQIQQTESVQLPKRTTPGLQEDFHQALEDLLSAQRGETEPATSKPLRFSRHAESRLTSRGITLDEDQLHRLGDAVDRLDQRGARESLVVLDDHAFIIGVPKRTVITAMSRTEAVGNIFTQIDSTFFVP